MERQLGRLEKQIECVEQQNANPKAELSKLRARVDQNTKDKKAHARRSLHGLADVDAIDVQTAGAVPQADVRIV